MIDGMTIHEIVETMVNTGAKTILDKRVALNFRVSASDGQTTSNQLRHLHEVAQSMGQSAHRK